jgi:hypothetical protein
MVHNYNPSYTGGGDQEDCSSKPAPEKKFQRPYLKNTQYRKRTSRVSQMVEHLPRECVLVQGPVQQKKRKKKRKKEEV